MNAALPRVLLIEPQFVLRRTIVAVSRDMAAADIQEATSLDVALPLLLAGRFDGLVMDIGVGSKALDVLARLRAGGFASPANTPVVALTDAADAAPDGRLAPFRVLRAICKPFKVAELLKVLQSMSAGTTDISPAAPATRPRTTQPA